MAHGRQRPLRTIHRALLACAALGAMSAVHGCERSFPAIPTPLANSPVTTLSGSTYSGSVDIGGVMTPYNMTLIARALGRSSDGTRLAQAPDTVVITGSFETGTGLKGTVEGALVQGTLQDGVFDGVLRADAAPATPACSRSFAGPVTIAGVLWSPTAPLPQGCPLSFAIEAVRTSSTPCTFSLTATPATFTSAGGSGLLSVATASECAWRPESLVPWILLSNSEPRTAGGSVPFTVGQNPGVARQGQVRVSGQTISISQTGAPGTVTLTISGNGSLRIPADLQSPQIAACQSTAGKNSCANLPVPSGTITIRATPGSDAQWVLSGWTGCTPSNPLSLGTCTLSVLPNGQHNVVVTFLAVVE